MSVSTSTSVKVSGRRRDFLRGRRPTFAHDLHAAVVETLPPGSWARRTLVKPARMMIRNAPAGRGGDQRELFAGPQTDDYMGNPPVGQRYRHPLPSVAE